MKNIFQKFFDWYSRNEKLALYLTTFLFLWQLVHLYWLSVDVVALKLFNVSFWELGKFGKILIALVDYTEIPAIILASVLYLNELKKKFNYKSFWLLLAINSQWVHLFWITDEVVVEQFTGTALIALPIWLSWIAILIDYLELPVIYDTIKKSILSLRKR